MKSRARARKHKRQKLSVLTGRLRGQSRKITGPRQAILEILRRHPHPMTNREILAAMPKNRCDLATIYRAMHLLKKWGWSSGLISVTAHRDLNWSGKATTGITIT